MFRVIREISQWEWLVLLLLLPMFLFPQESRAVMLLILPVFLVFRRVAFGYFFPSTPYNATILLLLATIGASLFFTFDLELSLPKITGLLVGIWLMYATINFSKEQDVWPIVTALLAIGAAVCLVSLIASDWQSPFDFLNRTRELLPGGTPSRLPGAPNGLVNANELAGVLCWIAPIMLACVIGLQHRLWRRNPALYALLVTITALAIFLIFATSSRGGIFAFVVASVVVLAYFATGQWRLVLAIGIGIIAMAVISYAARTPGNDIVGDTVGLSGRIEIWSRAILAIGDNPLTGVGINGFRQIVHVLYPMFGISSDVDIAHAHNHFLQAGLDLGIPGLISYYSVWLISVGLIVVTTRNLLKRKARRNPYFTLVAGLGGSLLGGWIFGVFDTVALGSRPGFIWWMTIGLISSVHFAVVHSGRSLRSRKSRSESVHSTTTSFHL